MIPLVGLDQAGGGLDELIARRIGGGQQDEPAPVEPDRIGPPTERARTLLHEGHPVLAGGERERAVGGGGRLHPELHRHRPSQVEAGAARHLHVVVDAVELQRLRDGRPQPQRLQHRRRVGVEAQPRAQTLQLREHEVVRAVVEWVALEVQRLQVG